MIDVQNLRKSYGEYEAIRGVSFTAQAGRVIGLLGPNGAGKTTIMKVLTGYYGPSSGTVRIDGFDASEDTLEIKRRIGYLPETVPLYADQTAREYLEFIAAVRGLKGAQGIEALESAASRCGIRGVLAVPIDHLSKGFRQRVGLAQAILGDPPVLILDEPTTGLDPNQILEIRSLIRSLGAEKTVLLSTHNLQEVEALCSYVLILNDGEIVARGEPSEIAESLKGEDLLDVVLKGSEPENITKAVSRLAVGKLSGVPESWSSGSVRLRIACPAGRGNEAAEAVSDWAQSEGFKILELKRRNLSMEEIFVRLTSEENRG